MFQGVHLTDEYRDNVNRFKKVPAIVDNGFQLSESVAIFRYLVSRNQESIDDQWYPKNDQIRGRIDEYLEWQHTNTRLTCSQYFILKYLKPRTIGFSPDDINVIASAEKQMGKTLDKIENLWLKPGRFISGTNQLSFADLLAACELEQTSKCKCLVLLIFFILLRIPKFLLFLLFKGSLDMIQPLAVQILKNG